MTPSSCVLTDLDSKSPNPSDLPLQPLRDQQLGFIAALHPDITLLIFSYLKQADCLTCMLVCRDWYYVIPQYAQSAWTTIDLDPSDAYVENMCRARCLGDHVKNVILRYFENEQELNCIMNKLLDWRCTKIKSLKFKSCKTKNQYTFLRALEKLAPYVTHLKILDHGSNIPFLHIFKACPELTHFMYEVRLRVWQSHELYHQEPVVCNKPELSPLTLTTKITHLFLDLAMTNPDRVYPILQCCPELRCYIGPTKRNIVGIRTEYTNSIVYGNISINLDRLFDLCPKINHVEPLFTPDRADELEDIDFYTNDLNCTGIRKLDICESYGGDRIVTHLVKNQDTLEYLLLRVYNSNPMFDWSPVFRSLQLTQLHTLKLQVFNYDPDSLTLMLGHCPSLQTLELNCEKWTSDSPKIEALGPLHRLRSLELSYLEIDDIRFKMLLEQLPALEKLSLSIATIFTTAPQYTGHAINQLKHLSLWTVYWTTGGTCTEEEAVAHFFYYWIAHSRLESLTSAYVPMFGRNTLLSVAKIPTLKICNVELDQRHLFNENDLFQFAAKLRGTAIEKLTLDGIEHMSFRILDTLAELPRLKELHLPHINSTVYGYKISILGLFQILRKSTSMNILTFNYSLLDNSLGVVPDYDSLALLIKQETPQYYMEKDVYNVIIKRKT